MLQNDAIFLLQNDAIFLNLINCFINTKWAKSEQEISKFNNLFFNFIHNTIVIQINWILVLAYEAVAPSCSMGTG